MPWPAKGVKRDDALFLKRWEKPCRLRETWSGTVGRWSRSMRRSKKVADTPANVLILGESGTGKELVAEAIHENSSRRNMPFVVINCGGIPENLPGKRAFRLHQGILYRRLFGQGRTFSKSLTSGTIFLDEIARASASASGQAPAGCPGKDLPPHRRRRRHPGRCAHHLRHQSESGG